MAETKKERHIFTVARVFFLLIVIPSLLISFMIANSIFKLGDISKERAVVVLDQRSKEEILARATTVAENVADFLRERQRDILIATILPATETTYKEFIDKNKLALWVKKDGKIVKVLEPLYVEMSLVDKNGNELIKIAHDEIVPKTELLVVSNPANTTYKSEDYFSKTKNLNKGDVYISNVTGWYVNKFDFEKGKRFEGIVRLATPLFDKNGFAGIITLALDIRHLAKYTDNIIPTQADYVLESDASTGNYTFMINNRGFVISHPNDYHIAGLYKDGSPVPPLTDKTYKALTEKGEEVLDLNLLGFMDTGLSEIEKDVSNGKSGIKTYKFKDQTKIVAYAPIQFYSKNYPEPAGFGWIGMGVEIEKFNEYAKETSRSIEKEAQAWMSTIVLILVLAVVLLFIIAAILARGINRSIESEVPPEALKSTHHYNNDDED